MKGGGGKVGVGAVGRQAFQSVCLETVGVGQRKREAAEEKREAAEDGLLIVVGETELLQLWCQLDALLQVVLLQFTRREQRALRDLTDKVSEYFEGIATLCRPSEEGRREEPD